MASSKHRRTSLKESSIMKLILMATPTVYNLQRTIELEKLFAVLRLHKDFIRTKKKLLLYWLEHNKKLGESTYLPKGMYYQMMKDVNANNLTFWMLMSQLWNLSLMGYQDLLLCHYFSLVILQDLVITTRNFKVTNKLLQTDEICRWLVHWLWIWIYS